MIKLVLVSDFFHLSFVLFFSQMMQVILLSFLRRVFLRECEFLFLRMKFVSLRWHALSGKLKTLTSSNYHRVEYYFGDVYYLPIWCSPKWCSGFFRFCLNLELFAKIKKDLLFTHSLKTDQVFYIFINNSRSKQNKNIASALLLM